MCSDFSLATWIVLFQLPLSVAAPLLRGFKWRVDGLVDAYLDNPTATLDKFEIKLPSAAEEMCMLLEATVHLLRLPFSATLPCFTVLVPGVETAAWLDGLSGEEETCGICWTELPRGLLLLVSTLPLLISCCWCVQLRSFSPWGVVTSSVVSAGKVTLTKRSRKTKPTVSPTPCVPTTSATHPWTKLCGVSWPQTRCELDGVVRPSPSTFACR